MIENNEAEKPIVLVTGGRSGIGRAIADAFAGQGANVLICGRDETAMSKTLAKAPLLNGFIADVGDPQSVRAMYSHLRERFGRIDVLVNNAGVSGPTAPVDEITDEEWRDVIAINLNGAFFCAREAAAMMKTQRSGCIINVSTTSVRLGLPERTPYVSTKAGLHGLTKALARELGPYNIRCNTLSPGMVDNARGKRVREARAEAEGESPEALLARRLNFISMRSMVAQEDIAALALYLASNSARFVTGQEISVCGNVEWE